MGGMGSLVSLPAAPSAPPTQTATAVAAKAACLVQGPFGKGVKRAFDDASAAAGGPITLISTYSNDMMTSIKFDYGGRPGLKHGGSGGTLNEFILAPNEYVTKVTVQGDDVSRLCGFRRLSGVASLYLETTFGRTHAMGPGRPDDPHGPPFVSATPSAVCGRPPLVLHSISGVAGRVLETLFCTWVEYPLMTGPFGKGHGAKGPAFNDFSLSSSGDGRSSPITAVRVWSGCWMDAIQVDYHGKPGLKHGGDGGSPEPGLLTLEPGEHITSAKLQIGWCEHVAAILFGTSFGRSMHMGTPLQTDIPFVDATPQCGTVGGRAPVLVALSGVGANYVESVTFHWAFPTAPKE